MTPLFPLFRVPQAQHVIHHVGAHHTHHVDRILGAAVGRSIGEIQIDEIGNLHVVADRRGQNVDSLVHTVLAHCLGSEYQTVALADVHHEVNLFRAGEVSGMLAGMKVKCVEFDSRLSQGGTIGARHRSGEAANSDDRRSQRGRDRAG